MAGALAAVLKSRPLRSALSALAGLGMITFLELLAVLGVSAWSFAAPPDKPLDFDVLLMLLAGPIALAGGLAAAATAGRREFAHACALAVLLLFSRFMAYGEDLRWTEYLDLPFIALGGALSPALRKALEARRKRTAD